jgi:branched-chain amino acid aminotransferase
MIFPPLMLSLKDQAAPEAVTRWCQREARMTSGTDPGAAAPQPPWPGGAAWVDGRYCPIEEAAISVLDLGVTRSDCTYDVVHVWGGRFYRLDAHLDRFTASMARLRLDPGASRAEIEAILHGCVRHAGLREAYVDPSVKNYHWLDLDLALLEAYDHGADLVVLRDLSGAVTEGPGYNVFAHVGGRWLTPASGTLQGITRRSMIELAREAGHQVQEGRLTAEDLYRAAEVLVTSTAGGIMPVTVLDGRPVGPGAPGPLTRQLRDRYWASHEDPRYSTAVRYDEPA